MINAISFLIFFVWGVTDLVRDGLQKMLKSYPLLTIATVVIWVIIALIGIPSFILTGEPVLVVMAALLGLILLAILVLFGIAGMEAED
ncbi:MAG: hypothetical protein A3I54_01130 [Candidatus Levybacteria bacterium RIFCSPLOWO2_02_FULL_41_11]|nr:MAG: hypothetical protein A2869_01675 [Candidatus Levybacteria bacterium RIFCSPHIGHO2_01_FULL_40_58]OGH40340.1 MAG: hypothetical protein A2894_05310 [Candidatus Levybacteria bacterium RIFCSPLOWO2_01_FULL_40_64]OGH49232.1 MAG: hypothetical protein A3I54_01130 [Candidatus Levybacteria bacterium RIFCSPLOWO2_02_FULL_41_11]